MSKRKSSPGRAAAARRNGANSKGPKTDAGKKRSSLISLKHGLCAARGLNVILPAEDPAQLQALTNTFYHSICPQNDAEASLVNIIVAQTWRGNRIVSFETELLIANAEE